jgi:hypothetical protein
MLYTNPLPPSLQSSHLYTPTYYTEAKFLGVIGTKNFRQSPLPADFTRPPLLEQNDLKLVCNVNNVYGNLKSENSQDYALRNLNEILR